MFDDHVPTADAAAVRRARAAGAIVVGKAATDEFAYGIAGVNPHFGATRNPWAGDRVSGGSSSGSAATVAALGVPLALGSDTGGSIRVPVRVLRRRRVQGDVGDGEHVRGCGRWAVRWTTPARSRARPPTRPYC